MTEREWRPPWPREKGSTLQARGGPQVSTTTASGLALDEDDICQAWWLQLEEDTTAWPGCCSSSQTWTLTSRWPMRGNTRMVEKCLMIIKGKCRNLSQKYYIQSVYERVFSSLKQHLSVCLLSRVVLDPSSPPKTKHYKCHISHTWDLWKRFRAWVIFCSEHTLSQFWALCGKTKIIVCFNWG